ncbi:epoxide hydrolase family protein [Stackebrandtia soli]|uniref:epoxide hydrolase family protein n=1 Tax=Stackebrandtia soli TaxID=1892856 RepID=UPI0039ED1E51
MRERLSRARFAQEIPDSGSTYGVPVSRVRHLIDHFLNDYDWRVWEERLNSHPQFTTEIDGQNVHFLHVESPESDAIPLLLTHGWPGTVVEFVDMIDPLTDPKANGSGSPAFHLVIPSLPGFGFSGPTVESGWGAVRTAKAWRELMARLGYERYGLHGNDAGAFVAPEVGRIDRDHVLGVHVNQIFSFPSGDPTEMEGMSDEELAALERLQWFHENMSSYDQLQSQQPQTLAHALVDSPAGLLAWMDQLFGEQVDDDFVLTNVLIHWFNDTIASSMRFYYENEKSPVSTEPADFPMASSSFAGDFQSIRRFSERDYTDIVQWRVHDTGGHYAARQAPDVLATDLRDFFGQLG